jgi:hypothetical protein
MVIKVSNQLIENQMQKLVNDNTSLKKHLAELEARLKSLNESSSAISSRLSQLKLLNTSEMLFMGQHQRAEAQKQIGLLAPMFSDNEMDSDRPVSSFLDASIQTLTTEFNSMMQKQEEMRRLYEQINLEETTISHQVTSLTEKLNKSLLDELDDDSTSVSTDSSNGEKPSKEDKQSIKVLKQVSVFLAVIFGNYIMKSPIESTVTDLAIDTAGHS